MKYTSITWPVELPQQPWIRVGDRITIGYPDNLVVHSKPDAGPLLARPRSTAYYRPYSIPLVVETDTEVEVFDEFYIHTLAMGTQPFMWTGWVKSGPGVFMFDLSEDPPTPMPLGNEVHLLPLKLLQYPIEVVGEVGMTA